MWLNASSIETSNHQQPPKHAHLGASREASHFPASVPLRISVPTLLPAVWKQPSTSYPQAATGKNTHTTLMHHFEPWFSKPPPTVSIPLSRIRPPATPLRPLSLNPYQHVYLPCQVPPRAPVRVTTLLAAIATLGTKNHLSYLPRRAAAHTRRTAAHPLVYHNAFSLSIIAVHFE